MDGYIFLFLLDWGNILVFKKQTYIDASYY